MKKLKIFFFDFFRKNQKGPFGQGRFGSPIKNGQKGVFAHLYDLLSWCGQKFVKKVKHGEAFAVQDRQRDRETDRHTNFLANSGDTQTQTFFLGLFSN